MLFRALYPAPIPLEKVANLPATFGEILSASIPGPSFGAAMITAIHIAPTILRPRPALGSPLEAPSKTNATMQNEPGLGDIHLSLPPFDRTFHSGSMN